MPQFRILFVCLGNICRSPLAHAVFEDLAKKNNLTDKFEIDSCGTGAWHTGELPDKRMRKEASKHGVAMDHPARTLQKNDFEYFDLILPMDLANYDNLKKKSDRKFHEKIKMFRSFDPKTQNPSAEVPDPYFGDQNGFANVYETVERTCKNLLKELNNI
ncbi:MAG: protein tyrosine phosphatase [Candidatus Cloacimonadota bacterium]|nr:MAG: protein tyrosine phosphatase [Candidatus Cloacimonadota bacterium]